jgi:hypothetical protein
LSNVYIATALWHERPEDYAVGHRFATNRFINAVARTVAHFDPDNPDNNDYRTGNHTLLLWGRPRFAAEGGAQAPLFLLYHPLQGLLAADGNIAWNPRFFAGYHADTGAPRWSSREADAVPVYGGELEVVQGATQLAETPEFDLVNHAAITWVESLRRWVMFYGGSVPDWMRSDQSTGVTPPIVHPQPVPNAIHMRSAAHPFGRSSAHARADEAWTEPVPVLAREAMGFLSCDQAALVSPLPERTGGPPRRAALDEALAELEFHVRRLSLHRRAQELRRCDRYVQDHMVRDHGRLRGMSRAGVASPELGEGQGR